MTGIVTVRAILYILMIAVSGGLFLYTITAGGLTWIKASNVGILRFHKIFHKSFYWFYYMIVVASLVVSVLNFTEARSCRNVIEASKTVGVQAFLAYEEEFTEIENEAVYIAEKQQEYFQKMNHNQQNGFFYLFMALLWFSMMMLNTGFVTVRGYYPLGSLKAKKLLAEAKDGELQFYLLPIKKGERTKPFLTIKDTPKNRKDYAPLLEKKKRVKGK